MSKNPMKQNNHTPTNIIITLILLLSMLIISLPALSRGEESEYAYLPILFSEATTPTPTSTPTMAAMSTSTSTATPMSTSTPAMTPTPTSAATSVAVLSPFDANSSDWFSGPSLWGTNYGKSPEIIVASNGSELSVLAQDYNDDTAWNAVLLQIEPGVMGYEISEVHTNLPMLDQVMGLAIDDAGNRYYATNVDESSVVDSQYPPLNTYRTDIVRVIKLDTDGNVLFNIDLDIARHDFDGNAEMIINPTVAGSARLVVGGNEIGLLHSINTDPDWNIGGQRHQKALSTRLNATSGEITAVRSVWASHSFDQRLLYDGEGIVEQHLGDAYPRYIVFNRDYVETPVVSHSLFHIKGDIGDNNTFTRLGNVSLIENDPNYRYIGLLATESTTDIGDPSAVINGARNLAIVRVSGQDNGIDPALPDTLTVMSGGTEYTNRLRWLTNYSEQSNLHAERPKLVAIGNDRYVVLWEEWLYTGSFFDTYNGVYGMVIDASGAILQPAKLLTNAHHLHRGDDAFLLDNRAAWMTGNADEQHLVIHFVDEFLNYEPQIIELP